MKTLLAIILLALSMSASAGFVEPTEPVVLPTATSQELLEILEDMKNNPSDYPPITVDSLENQVIELEYRIEQLERLHQ